VLTASDEDAERVRAMGAHSRTAVYPNTIPSTAPPARLEEDVVTFSANMEYHPNSDAVRHFHRRIWPLVKARSPRLTWELVGMNPNAVRRYVGDDPSVRLKGPVEDAVAELARAKVSVVPLRSGSGTRVKILEAWAAGTPVVSTSMGAEGLGAAHGRELLIADEPAAFADAVSSLIASPELGRELARAGRALYEQRYTWEAGWRELADAGI
jgi:glycosyltransferase involved in cell wall biosynthesis